MAMLDGWTTTLEIEQMEVQFKWWHVLRDEEGNKRGQEGPILSAAIEGQYLPEELREAIEEFLLKVIEAKEL